MRYETIGEIFSPKVFVAHLEGVKFLARIRPGHVCGKHPGIFVFDFFSTHVWEQLVPPSVKQSHFEVISWLRRLLSFIENSHADGLAVNL